MVDILLAQIAGVDVSEITKEEAFQGKVLQADTVVKYSFRATAFHLRAQVMKCHCT